ncbi:MAG: sugar phosphate isomerase/epimerase [Clostridia bacterium]|nr:sugar phosphate isomerase/epimerase [Clostridia bacterium]
MKTGMSSACFYPLETEKSVKKCGEMGFKNIEIFVNSYCELNGAIRNEIKAICNYYGMKVCSVHPFTSFAESFVFFGSYGRRIDDGIEFYKNYFDFASYLGAGLINLHGAKTQYTVDNEEYFDRYARLFEAGKDFGITISQENVVDHRSQSPVFIKRMSDYLGDNFALTLDLKQCRRAGEKATDFIDTVGEKIKAVHISDFANGKDCIPPFEGNEDFDSIVKALQNKGYNGEFLIELYSNGFENEAQIVTAADKFDKILL